MQRVIERDNRGGLALGAAIKPLPALQATGRGGYSGGTGRGVSISTASRTKAAVRACRFFHGNSGLVPPKLLGQELNRLFASGEMKKHHGRIGKNAQKNLGITYADFGINDMHGWLVRKLASESSRSTTCSC